MNTDKTLLAAAREAAKAIPHFRRGNAALKVERPRYSDGQYIECGKLVIDGRTYRLQLSCERYARDAYDYWYGVQAGSRTSVEQLVASLEGGGRGIATMRTGADTHVVDKKKGFYQLSAPIADGDWERRLVPESYPGEHFLGIYHRREKASPSVLAAAAVEVWRAFDEANRIENILEGEVVVRTGKGRTRSAKLRAQALARFVRNGMLSCAACDFTVPATASPLSVIEFHHTVQIASYGRKGRASSLDALEPLCPTCHRIAHRGRSKTPRTSAEVRRERLKL